MKYVKGNQTFALTDDGKGEQVPMCKCRLVCQGEAEGIWIRQGHGEVALLNDSLAFYPFRSWGVIFPSKSHPNDESDLRETIDVTKIRGTSPDGVVLTLHPEAWDSYIKQGIIDEDGNFIIPNERKQEDE
jgi:hypothetical protein